MGGYPTTNDIRTSLCVRTWGIRNPYPPAVARTHLEDDVAVFCEVRKQWAGRIELQGVSLVPIEDFDGDYGATLANLVAECGGVLGAITRPMIGAQDGMATGLDDLLDVIFRLAKERPLDIDLHVDETGAGIVARCRRGLRNRFKGQVVCGHCCSLALRAEEIFRPTLQMCADAGIAVVSLPVVNMHLQDRFPGRTPRWSYLGSRGSLQSHALREKDGALIDEVLFSYKGEFDERYQRHLPLPASRHVGL